MRLVAGAGAAALAAFIPFIANAADNAQAAVAAAVAESTRPDADRQRDALRKPAAVLEFAGIKPGAQVIELMPGSGYYTRILCRLVGEQGHVTTVTIEPAVKMDRPAPPPQAAAMSPNPCTNVTALSQKAAELSLPTEVDAVWTSENYHDFHNSMFGAPDMVQFDRKINAALKRGGVFIIEDHAAEAGSGARDTETLHRIDPALVKKEAEAAGFVLAGSSDLLKNADDTHAEKVFALKGQSDKMLLKFRKP